MNLRILLFSFLVALATLSPFSGAVFAQQEIEHNAPSEIQDTFYRGKVLEATEEKEEEQFGVIYRTQELQVELQTGEDKGNIITLQNEYEPDIAVTGRSFAKGDRIIVGRNNHPPEVFYYISDTYRLNTLWWMAAIFILLSVLFAKKQGVRAFVGLFFTFLVIFLFVIPRILAGDDPVLISVIGTIIIASSSIYIAHGVRARTHIAFISITLTLLLAFILGWIFVNAAHLTGIGTEDAFYLQFAEGVAINLKGLLLGAIILGSLGILDDVATAQAAAVEEIHNANPKLTQKQLYARGLSVGKEHIASLINTLVLAYTGAAFPLLLLFSIYERPAWIVINSEIIFEEITRMLVGSIALICAVPITTMLAAKYFAGKPVSKDYEKGAHAHIHTH